MTKFKILLGVGVLAAILGAVGYFSRTHINGQAAPSAAVSGPLVGVTSVRAQRRNMNVTLEVNGTVTALSSVEIRPQISSIITKVHIREGQFVKAGMPLFTLDARNEEANVAKARAQLAKDQSSLADVQRQFTRSRDLLAQSFISQGALDSARTLVESQQAVVDSDRAALEEARVALSYSRIVAPMAGRAGAINVFAGSTVAPTSAPLVTITQLDPIAVSFSLPQRHLPDVLQTLRSGGGEVMALLPEGRGTHSGRLQFVDNIVDAGSGTVRAKAHFDNPGEVLWPGAFVDVRLVVRTIKGAVVVPRAAIIQGPRGSIVYVVSENQKAAVRPVEVFHAAGEEAAVTGVTQGERVVLEGRQNLGEGAAVIERATPSVQGKPDALATGK